MKKVGPLLTTACAVFAAFGLSHCGQIGTDINGKSDGGKPDGHGRMNCSVSQEQATLQEIAGAMRNFHTDTGGWPFAHSVWLANDYHDYSTIMPGLGFNANDAALFLQPSGLLPVMMMSTDGGMDAGGVMGMDAAMAILQLGPIPACSATHTGGPANPCWNGPYLPLPTDNTAPSLGSEQWLDCWGNPRMYSYIRPFDGNGGGFANSQAANGLVYIWSRGPDGVDGFTCNNEDPTYCPGGFNKNQFVVSMCTQVNCDDLIVEVADSAI